MGVGGATVPKAAVEICLRHFGITGVSFYKKKEFCYSLRVCGTNIEVFLLNYLDDTPDKVFGDFRDMVCRRVRNLKWTEPGSYLDFVLSDSFITSKRPIYIFRSRNLLRIGCGETAYLYDSVQRLPDARLLTKSDVRNSYISWTRRKNVRMVRFCNTMFRVVGISARLDSDDIPDSVRNYVVCHECLHLR